MKKSNMWWCFLLHFSVTCWQVIVLQEWHGVWSEGEAFIKVSRGLRIFPQSSFWLRNVLFNEKWTSTGHAGWDLAVQFGSTGPLLQMHDTQASALVHQLCCGPKPLLSLSSLVYLVNCWEILHGSVGLSQRECDMPRSFALPLPCFFFDFKLGHRPPTSTMFAVRVTNL